MKDMRPFIQESQPIPNGTNKRNPHRDAVVKTLEHHWKLSLKNESEIKTCSNQKELKGHRNSRNSAKESTALIILGDEKWS